MKKRLITLWTIFIFVAILFLIVNQNWFSNNSKENGSSYERIGQQTVIDRLNSKETVIVDLREDYLYNKSHIPKAINIPFTEIQERFEELDKNKEIIFICHAGPMGEASSQLLIQNGYKHVSTLKGGMAQWTGPLESYVLREE